MEVWKDIKELQCLYKINEYGIVVKRNGKIKPNQDNGKGYKQLYVQINNKRKVFYIHRLVAEYFIPNPLNLKEVNHIDGDKSNNHIKNLEWISRIDNMKHASKNGLIRMGENSGKNKLTEKQVLAIRRLYKLNPNFNKLKVSIKLGVQYATIYKIIKNQKWKYLENPQWSKEQGYTKSRNKI